MAMIVMRWFCGATCGPSCNKAGFLSKLVVLITYENLMLGA